MWVQTAPRSLFPSMLTGAYGHLQVRADPKLKRCFARDLLSLLPPCLREAQLDLEHLPSMLKARFNPTTVGDGGTDRQTDQQASLRKKLRGSSRPHLAESCGKKCNVCVGRPGVCLCFLLGTLFLSSYSMLHGFIFIICFYHSFAAHSVCLYVLFWLKREEKLTQLESH